MMDFTWAAQVAPQHLLFVVEFAQNLVVPHEKFVPDAKPE
jgi:hypothetical protein